MYHIHIYVLYTYLHVDIMVGTSKSFPDMASEIMVATPKAQMPSEPSPELSGGG